MSKRWTAVLLCCAVGVSVAGCSDGGGAGEPSAKQRLDRANDTMRALKSVTVVTDTDFASGAGMSASLTTDLKSRCSYRTTSSRTGASLEQIRIGETDYVRPNRAYLKESGRTTAGADEQRRWVKVPSSRAVAGDGLTDCTWPFASFGDVTEGQRTEVDGTPAVGLEVRDAKDEQGSYTFYVATEGKPYLLKVVHEGAQYDTTTSFGDFDEPLDVRPPAGADVLDASGIGTPGG
ncbi:hypothetical protein ACPF8X_25480 [Streptomyces sp. G35A]